MNILLLNTNPVVSRLIALCTRDEDTILEEVTDMSTVKLDSYDIVFVDDAAYISDVQNAMKNMVFGKKILLSGKQSTVSGLEEFDEAIRKPFLPSQITAVIERFSKSEEAVEEKNEEGFIFPLSQEEHIDNLLQTEDEGEEEGITVSQDPEVLDGHEIKKIKALLEEDDDESEVSSIEEGDDYETRKIEAITEHLEADGLEIISEDKIVDILSADPKKKSKKKKVQKIERRKSKKEKKEDIYTFEEALIAAIEEMKPKKIKKLLKGAEVTLKINFKGNK